MQPPHSLHVINKLHTLPSPGETKKRVTGQKSEYTTGETKKRVDVSLIALR